MGRSVSTPSSAEVVAFHYLEPSVDGETGEVIEFTEEDFEDYLDWIKETAMRLWPSFSPCDHFVGREDRAVLSNDFCYLGVSEYCGVVAIWLLPHGGAYNIEQLGAAWAWRIGPKFCRTFGTMRRLGVMSNGEAVFRREDAA